MTGPSHSMLLQGVRVVDLTTVVFGPLATQVLADYGADVIKIEPPGGDIMRHAGCSTVKGMGAIFLNLNRGKRSICLDLKTEGGRQVLRRLLETADIFVHNVRRAAMDRLGLSYPEVSSFNPKILYCTATGFAENTQRADAAAIDDVIQSATGIAALNANAQGVPQFVQSLLADKVAAMGLACAVLAALHQRTRTGKGCLVDVPMYETLASFTLLEHMQGQSYEPAIGGVGYHRVMSGGGRRVYKAKDGYLSMTPYSTTQWAEFFKQTGRPELAQDARILDPVQRNAHVAELYDLIAQAAGERTVDEWVQLAARLGFPAQRVNTLTDVVADADLDRSGALLTREHPGVGQVRNLASPGFFNGSPARHPGLAPRLAQHSTDILDELGFTSVEVDALTASGAVCLGETA